MTEHAAHAAPTQVAPPEPRGVCIDVIDLGDPSIYVPPAERRGGHTLHVGQQIRFVIDGREPWYMPADTEIEVSGGRVDATRVTLTLFARRVRFGFADELDGPVGLMPGEPRPEEALDAQMRQLAETHGAELDAFLASPEGEAMLAEFWQMQPWQDMPPLVRRHLLRMAARLEDTEPAEPAETAEV